MKKTTLTLAMSLAAFVFSANLKAQADSNTDEHTITISVPQVAILDIEPAASKNITLGFTAPTEAGLPITPTGTDNTLWLNYSSIKSDANATLSVTVKLDTIIPGIDIRVTAAAPTGAGDGTLGTAAAQLTLTAAEQDIVTGIGSAYTGDGANNGHNLTYELAPGSSSGTIAAYADLYAAASSVATVTYTISEN